MKELLRRMGFGFVLFGMMLMVIAVSAPGPLVGCAGGIIMSNYFNCCSALSRLLRSLS